VADRILIIDDDPVLSETTGDALEMNGYQVLRAFDGETGLAVAKKERPDLILLDVTMPDLDGFQVCGLIRIHPDIMKTPIIMLTGRDKGEDLEVALERKANWYITKPYDMNYLLKQIKKFLQPAS
jgi:two-component system alkaline phosphatase synthesis response regulator PhoP